jgi:hypothetical protein
LILWVRGDLAGAMEMLKDQERNCRELGNPRGLGEPLANQAMILGWPMGKTRAALESAEEAYRLATTHGLVELARKVKGILVKLRAKRKRT